MEKNLIEDIEFARKTEEAWKRYDKCKFRSMDGKDFLVKLKKW